MARDRADGEYTQWEVVQCRCQSPTRVGKGHTEGDPMGCEGAEGDHTEEREAVEKGAQLCSRR